MEWWQSGGGTALHVFPSFSDWTFPGKEAWKRTTRANQGAGNGVKQNLDLAGTWLDLAVDCFVPIELPCIGDVDVTVLDQKKVEKRRCYTL